LLYVWFSYDQGASIDSLLHSVRGSARTVLAIETMGGEILGSFTSSPWRYNKMFYGSGEAFVWRLQKSRLTPCGSVAQKIAVESDVKVYKWTGNNRNVQLTNNDTLAVGSDSVEDEQSCTFNAGCFAFALTKDLGRGTSGPTATFGNPSSLASAGVFEVANVEVWTLSPVDDLEQAEKIELSRQFIFDHGNFVQE